MKKFFIMVALLMVPFAATAGMITMTNSDMEITTGQLGIGVDITALDLDVELSTGVIDVIPSPLAGAPGVIQIGALDGLEIGVELNGDIDADIEVTPAGIAIAADITDLGVTISDLDLDIDCLATDGSGDPNTLAPMNLANLEITDLAIGVGAVTLLVDVIPTVGLAVGTTQLTP